MTRKDYILLAAALKNQHFTPDQHSHSDMCAYLQWQADCQEIATALQKDNPRFERARFLAACGL